MNESSSSAPDGRAALVDLGLLAGGRVDHREVDPGLLGDPDEVREDRFFAELLDHALAVRTAGEAGGDHRTAEQPEGTGDVDALATRHGAALDRAVTVSLAEVRNSDRAVDGGIQCHRDNHRGLLVTLRNLLLILDWRRLLTNATDAKYGEHERSARATTRDQDVVYEPCRRRLGFVDRGHRKQRHGGDHVAVRPRPSPCRAAAPFLTGPSTSSGTSVVTDGLLALPQADAHRILRSRAPGPRPGTSPGPRPPALPGRTGIRFR